MPYKDPEKRKQYHKKYYQEHKAEFRVYGNRRAKQHRAENRIRSKKHYQECNDYYVKYRLEHKEENKEYQRIYRKNHSQELTTLKKEKNLTIWGDATHKLNYAKKKGLVIQKPCEICGDENSQAHHYDYNKPLDVMWLCPKYHGEWHRKNTPIYRKD